MLVSFKDSTLSECAWSHVHSPRSEPEALSACGRDVNFSFSAAPTHTPGPRRGGAIIPQPQSGLALREGGAQYLVYGPLCCHPQLPGQPGSDRGCRLPAHRAGHPPNQGQNHWHRRNPLHIQEPPLQVRPREAPEPWRGCQEMGKACLSASPRLEHPDVTLPRGAFELGQAVRYEKGPICVPLLHQLWGLG